MQVGIISLFPEMFEALHYGVTGRAIKQDYVRISYWNPRDFVEPTLEEPNKYRAVDDRPYGGGPGMVMKVKPLRDAINATKLTFGTETKVMHLSPQGKLLTQEAIIELAQE